MCNFPIHLPAFGEEVCFNSKINDASRVFLIPDAGEDRFTDYCALLERAGFASVETRTEAHLRFAACAKDGWGIFINYFPATRELQLVVEENTAYFSYTDRCGTPCVTPQITQLKLKDYGMTYAVGLSDGRFLVIDGGRPFPEDADRLFAQLKHSAPTEKPVIAAWLITHPHCDHMYGCFPFFARYGDAVTVEKFLFTFPGADDTARYPFLATPAADYPGRSTAQMQQAFEELVRSLGVPVYSPHTGQRYTIGDAQLTFLASIDDTIHRCNDLNATSLVFSMELGSQKILWGADACFSEARLAERYGAALKADILQIPHHGFGGGTSEGAIAAYRHIRPSVCLLSASRSEAFRLFCPYIPETRYLLREMDIDQLFVGGETHTLSLPFSPDPDGKAELERSFIGGWESAGSESWVFTELIAGSDLQFTVANNTYVPTQLRLELNFGGEIRTELLPLPDGATVTPGLPLADIPAGTPFTLRLTAGIPVAVSHPKHWPAHRSNSFC